jgi:hypothetical protein
MEGRLAFVPFTVKVVHLTPSFSASYVPVTDIRSAL